MSDKDDPAPPSTATNGASPAKGASSIASPDYDILPENWIAEIVSPRGSHLFSVFSVEELYHSCTSPFQKMDVCNLGAFGRSLLLDGKVQSTELDEFIYHESLVHPAMIMHPNPQKVFIAGGGEGATAREILRYKSVTNLVMCDLDRDVVDFSRKYLPGHSLSGAVFQDPRLSLLYKDAYECLRNSSDVFDIIFMDLPEPIEDGPCKLLYTKECYELITQRLNPENGIVVTQAGPASFYTGKEVFVPIVHTMQAVFEEALPYTIHIPSFCDMWGLSMGLVKKRPEILSEEEIDKRIADRLGVDTLRHYDGITHRNMFTLPKPLRSLLSAAGEKIVITTSQPVTFHKSPDNWKGTNKSSV